MMDKLIITLTIVTALGSGMTGGLYFAFSTAVMEALSQQPFSQGMSAMQSINLVILNPLFLTAFLGTAITGTALLIISTIRWQTSSSLWLIAGALLYVVGSFLLTIIFNVPLNNALAAADPNTAAGQEIWSNYLSNWTFWNHIRTVASFAAMASLTIGLTYAR